MTANTPTVWRPVVGYEGIYVVSDQGDVRSVDRILVQPDARGKLFSRFLRGKTLRLWVDANGYPHANLAGKRYTVHSLVAAAFLGPRPEGLQIRHLDGNPQNCTPGNLTYGTGSDNTLDQVVHGRHHEVNRVVCPLSHPLRSPNLETNQVAAGKRKCLACGRARSTARTVLSQGGVVVDFQALADAKYRQIVDSPGPLPKGPRSLPVIAGVIWPSGMPSHLARRRRRGDQ